MRLQINYKENKQTNKKKHMRVTQYATKLPMGHWRNQREIHKIAGDKWKWKQNDSNSVGCSINSSKREDHSDKSLFQERKLKNKTNKKKHLDWKTKLKQGAKCVIKQWKQNWQICWEERKERKGRKNRFAKLNRDRGRTYT